MLKNPRNAFPWIKWYKKYLPHYHELLPPDAYISKYEDLYGLETYQQRLAQFDDMIAYLDIEVDYNNVENFLCTDRRVFGKKAYKKIPNYQEMFDKYGDEKIILWTIIITFLVILAGAILCGISQMP